MFKSVFAATAALSLSAGAAVAGPFINVEANASYPDGEYSSAVTDFHLGFEGTAGDVGYYIQGGLHLSTLKHLMTPRPNCLVRLV